jgi:hypothetical protein
MYKIRLMNYKGESIVLDVGADEEYARNTQEKLAKVLGDSKYTLFLEYEEAK